MEFSLSLALVLVTTSVLSALSALLIAAALDGRRRGEGAATGREAVFLLAERGVIDANRRGTALLDTLRAREGEGAEGATDWQRLLTFLGPMFPDLADRLSDAGPNDAGPDAGDWTLKAADGSGLVLRGSAFAGSVRLSLSEPARAGDDEETLLVDRLGWRATLDELEVLRRTADLAPTPAWRESPEGEIVWANGAYLRLLARTGFEGPLVWPLPALFGAGDAPMAGLARRSLAAGPGGRLAWFDVIEVEDRGGRLFHALPADEAQKAERTRREFVQTLTKTFATLPVGLAVFDRTRRLQLFNPAIIDLTRLEPEFLASRPGLDGFLNRMRDKRILPEPRDFRAWTRRLLDVETAAAGTGFEETWLLPDGRSFRVSAAPHPDGALAFLIEDITSDTSLRRSLRAELDTGQAALDMVETALAVFSPAGDLVLTNAAFDRLWTLEGAETLAGVRFLDAVANWREAGDAPELWDRIAALVRPGAPEAEVTGEMRLPEGDRLRVRARPAMGGAMLLAFQLLEPPQQATRPPVLRRASA